MAVQRSAQFKKDVSDFDGMASDESVMAAILAHPERPITTITVWEVTDVKRSIREGTQTPIMRARHIEVMVSTDDIAMAVKLRDARYHERTNREAPPETLFDGPSAEGEPDEVKGAKRK